MFLLSVLIVAAIIILGLFALWVRGIIFVLKKSGYVDVTWSKALGIFVCLFIISRLFNPFVSKPVGDNPILLLVAALLGIAAAAVVFVIVLRLFLGGPLFSGRVFKAYIGYIVVSIVIGIPTFLAVLGVRTYVIAPFQMNGQAMITSLRHGEFIMVNKWDRTYERGDIAVFEAPLEERYYYVERIVGLPGETVIFDGTRVVIKNVENPQGFVLNEPYVNCPQGGCSYSNMSQTQFDIPAGSYFVMGDNRMNSTDSRFCFATCSDPDATPFLPVQNLVGKVMGVFWPFEASKMVTTPEYLVIPVTSR